MPAQHNPSRYGETHPQAKIDAYLTELEGIRDRVILSGGWAWHFLSPDGHVELKHAHDHKDADVFVEPAEVWLLIESLKQALFLKAKTRFDSNEFMRYEKDMEVDGSRFKIILDIFLRSGVPYREIRGWKVVEPEHLLTLYGDIHSSGNCFAVQAATKLLGKGIDPQGREELCEIPK